MDEKEFYSEIIGILKAKKMTKQQIASLKNKLSKKYGIKNTPTDIQILLNASPKDIKKIKLITKPTRTISGVAVVAVMSYPFKCPHGRCIMCPGGPSSVFGDVPQSYTGKEPAALRAIRNNYDPYLQVINRLEQYIVQGHIPDKAELIVMGGTFPSFEKSYQEDFVMNCFKAMNDFSKLFFIKEKFNFKIFKDFFELPGDIGNEDRLKNIHKKLLILKNKNLKNLENEQKLNEKSNIRCIGLTIETRPDFAKLKEANEMLRLGATRIEVGVQSVYEEALKAIKRGHSVNDTIESFKILKDLGFKINAHYMLGLPGISRQKDLDGLKELFFNSNFRPDMLKIYPCMVIKGTGLYDLYKAEKFSPLSTEDAAEIISEFKRFVPYYLRIMRIQRDIPTYVTEAGVGMTNLRQYVGKIAKEKGIKCRCIRCRESGRILLNKKIKVKEIKILTKQYPASGGIELFISAEDTQNDILFGFCRLRFPHLQLRKEITKDSALVRELHIYSPSVPLGKKSEESYQHKGLGRNLLATAEQIAKKHYKNKIIVISGIGAREYYKKLGYNLEGYYMVKKI